MARRAGAGMVALLAALAAGAAGARPTSPTVLPMAVADTGGPSSASVLFADEVRRLSKGTLLIAFRAPAQQTADGELIVIREVEQGTVTLGQIPTRAWDAAGVPTFAALQAPFLITDYALLKKVLAARVARAMLSGTRAAGVRTLGLAAADLHIPLGARHAFVVPSDFRGATIRVPSNSALTTAILGALGARAASIASGRDLAVALESGLIDGAVTAPGIVLQNGYYSVARYLTTNLVFFPRVDSVAINEHAFQALTPAQRSILTRAARQMTRRSFVGIRARDRRQLRLLCTAGVKLANSTDAQRAALRRAEQPVYAALKQDAATALRIAQIQALKRRTRPTPPPRPPSGCAL